VNTKFILRNHAIGETCKAAVGTACSAATLHEVEIRPHKARRSINQNSRYWAILGAIASETGNEPMMLHKHFKAEFLGMDVFEVFGRTHEWPRSTTKLNVGEFADYMTRLDAWCAEHGYVFEDYR